MGNLLTGTERKMIEKQRSLTRDKKFFTRLSVLIMLDEKFTYQDISISLGISEGTIINWRKRFEEKGIEGLRQDDYVAFQGYLEEDELSLLKTYVTEHMCYTTRQVGEWISQQFGVDYCDSAVGKLLKRLGFVYKQVKLVGHKVDEEAQKDFVAQFEEQVEKLDSQTTTVYFTDGVHPTHNVQPHRAWVLKGEEKVVPANTGRGRVNINGALNAHDVSDVVIEECDRVNTASTIALYEKLITRNPGKKVLVICDNARYYRSKELSEWLTDHPEIEQWFLPAYSPNLNLIERLWRFMKKQVCREFYPTYKKFKERILSFFDDIGKYKKELEELLTLNFGVLSSPL